MMSTGFPDCASWAAARLGATANADAAIADIATTSRSPERTRRWFS